MSEQPWPPCSGVGPIANIGLGLRVLGSELKWLVVNVPRTWERANLRKRLRQERALIGSLPDGEARALAHAQATFLEEEIAHLDAERNEAKQLFLDRRASRLNLNRET